MSDPDGWRDIDETQREEIARLRADAEYSFKRISSLEEENRRIREAMIKRDLSADLIAQIISEDASVEDGKVANVAYLAVKIAETIEQKP